MFDKLKTQNLEMNPKVTKSGFLRGGGRFLRIRIEGIGGLVTVSLVRSDSGSILVVSASKIGN